MLYGLSVRLFSEWLAAHGRPATLDELTRSAIREWLAELAETRVTSTVRTRFKGLHRFCGWLVAEGELSVHPMAGMVAPVAAETPVPILSDDELTPLLRVYAWPGLCLAARHRDDPGPARRRVRVSELCGLVVEGIDLDREMALVTGKGAKVRPVYFSARTMRALDSPARTG